MQIKEIHSPKGTDPEIEFADGSFLSWTWGTKHGFPAPVNFCRAKPGGRYVGVPASEISGEEWEIIDRLAEARDSAEEN